MNNFEKTHELIKRYPRLYSIWKGMKTRCGNRNSHNYKWYGGKGIRVCVEWQKFMAFAEWSLSHGYADRLSIDRIDYTKNYSPENCRWIPIPEQNLNQSNNRLISVNGEIKHLNEWAAVTGLNRETIAARIDRLGWTPGKAISSPASNHGIAIDEETKQKVLFLKGKMSGRKAAKLAGISETSLRRIWGVSK